jgi:trigger factor
LQQGSGLQVKGARNQGTEKPELNDEFAKDVSEFDTLEELKKDSGQSLKRRRRPRRNTRQERVLEKVYHANEIDIPTSW